MIVKEGRFVALEREDVGRCWRVAVARNRSNRGVAHTADYTGDGLAIHFPGAIAECAVAAVLDSQEWNMIADGPERYTGDVGPYEVKATEHPKGGLLLRRSHPEERVYILGRVNMDRLTVKVVGWAWGHEVKRREHWREDIRYPAFIMPGEELRPISTLST